MKADENGETILQAICDVFSKMYNPVNALKCSTEEHQIRTVKGFVPQNNVMCDC